MVSLLTWNDMNGFILMEIPKAWADNADHLSVAYSGTGALKTDYTR